MPVPACHHLMGGIPTTVWASAAGQHHSVVRAQPAGACVSVHGANRLGANSLLDVGVFGRRARHRTAASYAQGRDCRLPLTGEWCVRLESATSCRNLPKRSGSPTFAGRCSESMDSNAACSRTERPQTRRSPTSTPRRYSRHGARQSSWHRPAAYHRAGFLLELASAVVGFESPEVAAVTPARTIPTATSDYMRHAATRN